MRTALFHWFERIVEFVFSSRSERTIVEAPKLDLLDLVEQARQEWAITDRYFDCVYEPELVDHAILLKEAAQKKYMYLLRVARNEGLRAYAPEPLPTAEGAPVGLAEPAAAVTAQEHWASAE